MKKFRLLKRITAFVLLIVIAIAPMAASAVVPYDIQVVSNLAENGIPLDSLYHQNKVMPDTWVFTDGLGRVSLTYEDVGGPREGKTVAMMYWDWHTSDFASKGAMNTTEFMAIYPEAKNDFQNAAWPTRYSYYCYWNEPIYGYYRTTDEWVLRKQAELLANLGVDVIFNDHTNGNLTFEEGYMALFNVWQDARADGVASPDISFLFPFQSSNGSNLAQSQLEADIYENIYATDTYSDMWYILDGKPMVMGSYSYFTSDAMKNTFTWRTAESKYSTTSTSTKRWGWLSIYPQHVWYKSSSDRNNGIAEQITVGVACNHDYVNNVITAMNGNNPMGRSYTSTYPNRYLVEGSNASLYGYFFQEQFNYALEVDPSVIYITGWNEWHAWRQSDSSVWATQRGVLNALVDQFDNEYSRDIEPTKGELKDHYYYLAANYIRQYKGCNPIPTPSENKTIDIYGSVSQWNNVAPYYASYVGNTEDRNALGYAHLLEGTTNRGDWYRYSETSGRNDIIGSQVARDDDYIYFNVECAENITPYTDNLWMTLYIDIDQTNQGWETFDYVINKSQASADYLVLEKFTGDGYNSKKIANVEYNVDGRYMMVKIPKSAFGLEGDDFTINFSWTDNVHDEGDYDNYSGDIMDFYISGDVAPGGRFKYSYISGNGECDFPEAEEESLEFTSNNDGTCYVSGIGNCTGIEIVVPSIAPNGDAVTGIGALAFSTSAVSNFTSVVIPGSVTYIGDGAFSGCESLTTIYYDGLRDQWATVDIGENNEYLIGAKLLIICKHKWQAATCTEPRVCLKCNEVDGTALGHTEETIPAVPSTCTTPGLTEGKRCAACGEIITEQETIPVSDHSIITIPGKPPTCTETGLSAGEKCSACGMVSVDQEILPIVDHVYDDDNDETCNECGFTREVSCKHQNVQTLAAVSSSCTQTGLTEGKKCLDCDEVLVEQTILAATGHTEVIDKAVASTCTTAGKTEGKSCSVCGVVTKSQDALPLANHTYDDDNDATCNVCGFERDVYCKHTNVESLGAIAPTCTNTGLTEGKKCSDCGEIIIEQTEVAALGHIEVVDSAVAPTCTTAGKTSGKHCSVCNEVLVAQTTVIALGHTEVVDNAVVPTCTTIGKTSGKHCSVCNEVLVAQTTIIALGHTEVVDKAIAPTCISVGKTEGKHCSVCDEIIVEQTLLPATGHTEVIDKAVSPTCTTVGKTGGKSCSVCNEILIAQTTVAPLGHTEATDAAVAATCTEAGKTEGKHCSVCNEVLVAQTEIAASGHTEVIDEAVAPTCTEAGKSEGKHCSVCDTVTKAQESVAATGHTEVTDIAVDPTCTEAGKTEGKHCSVCSEVLVSQVEVEPLGHEYGEDGKCVRCDTLKEGFEENTTEEITTNGDNIIHIDISGCQSTVNFVWIFIPVLSALGFVFGKSKGNKD